MLLAAGRHAIAEPKGAPMRIAAGIIAGVLIAFAVVALIEFVGHQAVPVPSDVGLRDPEDPARLAGVPLAAKLIVVFAWFAGALAGAVAARRIAAVGWAPWVVGAVVAIAGIAVIMMIPHPFWMQLAAVLAPVLGVLVANHLLPRRPTTAAVDAE
jgi:hypothetical protein